MAYSKSMKLIGGTPKKTKARLPSFALKTDAKASRLFSKKSPTSKLMRKLAM